MLGRMTDGVLGSHGFIAHIVAECLLGGKELTNEQIVVDVQGFEPSAMRILGIKGHCIMQRKITAQIVPTLTEVTNENL